MSNGVRWYPVPVEKPGGGRIRDRSYPGDENLCNVPKYGGGLEPLHKHAADAYERMLIEARRDSIKAPYLEVVDGLRSTKAMLRNYKRALKKYAGKKYAKPGESEMDLHRRTRKYVAPPAGFVFPDGSIARGSARNSGRAVDFWLGYPIRSEFFPAMAATAAFRWLREHAVEFGFYPYEPEPHHWEYSPPWL
jgi:LAS superfamily LD-carboxypeptidase LdcB